MFLPAPLAILAASAAVNGALVMLAGAAATVVPSGFVIVVLVSSTDGKFDLTFANVVGVVVLLSPLFIDAMTLASG